MFNNMEEYFKLVRESKNPFIGNQERQAEQSFSVDITNKNDWFISTDDYFCFVLNTTNELQDQGWKIHISANVRDAANVLNDVSQVLISRKVSFKFIKNQTALLRNNSKYADRSSSGKFITIYPNSNTQFTELLPILKQITEQYFQGAYILSDKRWKNSNVFFRYGAFKKIEKTIDGKKVDCIKNPNGMWVEDVRVPYYVVPKFVTEPKIILENKNDVVNTDKLDEFTIKSALHFSNAGGVYQANKNGRTLVLKEGRPEAGLDAQLNDGYTRIKHEYQILKKLKKVHGVVSVKDYFKVWEHNYLVEEFVQGMSLHSFVMFNYPFSNKLKKSAVATKYFRRVQEIYNSLFTIIKNIHEEGIAVGDIQPENIIVNTKNDHLELKLIDFESSEEVDKKYIPALASPNFSSFNNELTFEENDWYAFYALMYYMLIPTEVTSALIPNINLVKKEYMSIFGDLAYFFLNHIDLKMARLINFENKFHKIEPPLTLPKSKICLENKKSVTLGLQRGIYRNFKYQFLIKNNSDFKLSVSNGPLGAIMALNRTNALDETKNDSIKLWVEKNYFDLQDPLNKVDTPLGLFNGLCGTCSLLFDLGYKDKAVTLLRNIDINMVSKDDISLYSGLSGIGIAFLAFYSITQEKHFLEMATNIATEISKSIDNKLFNFEAGLLYGLAGVVVFFDQLASVTKKEAYQSVAIDLMNTILANNLVEDKKRKFVSLDDHLTPYLDCGSTGIILVLLEIGRHCRSFLKGDVLNTLSELIDSCDVSITGHGSLFNGYSGFLLLDSALKTCDKVQKIDSSAIQGLNLYLAGYHKNEILCSDFYGFCCSMSLSEGAGGALLSIDQINNKDWGKWIPIPSDHRLDLFRSK